MTPQFKVTHLRKADKSMITDWAKREGWNPGLHDSECFYMTDPEGFFVGKLDGNIIAIGAGVTYDEQFAFFGLYIVEPAFRGQGYGLTLTKEILNYVSNRNCGLDGVVSMVKKYERLGFKFAHNNARYSGSHLGKKLKTKDLNIISLTNINEHELNTYDRLHFPAPREKFLSCWIHQKGSKSLGFLQNGKLAGYGVIRPCFKGYKIGPLFADNPDIADALLLHLAHHAKEQTVYLDIPECNRQALNLVHHYQMTKVFGTARMYLHETPPIALDQIYGITSFELG